MLEAEIFQYCSVPDKRPWELNHKPSFFTILDAYGVQQLKETGSIIIGVALARYVHARICMLYIEHVCIVFRPNTRATRKEESYACKLGDVTRQNRKKDRDCQRARVDHARLVGFVIAVV